jgi:hypothetical protein
MTSSSDSETSVACPWTSLERDAADGNDIAADGDVDDGDLGLRSGDRAISFDDSGASSAARKYAVTIGLTLIDPVADAPDRVCVGCRAISRKARASAGVA